MTVACADHPRQENSDRSTWPDKRGLRLTSIHSYRDAVRPTLFVSADARPLISQWQFEDLTLEQLLGVLQHLETTRRNDVVMCNHG
jgi:hypothetical protein